MKGAVLKKTAAAGFEQLALRLLLFIVLSNNCSQAFGIDSDGDVGCWAKRPDNADSL